MRTTNAEPARPRATYQDVIDASPHVVAEIVDGKLYTHPRPAPKHAKAHSVLGGVINPAFDSGRSGPGGWHIFDEPELHLGGDVVVPDIAGWRRERMPHPPTKAYFTLAPDWVCEVLSPSTRKLDLGAKWEFYAREEVAHYWIVDPEDHTIEADELRSGEWVLTDRVYGDRVVSLPPFEAIEFHLGDLWLPDTAQKPHTVHQEVPVIESESG